MVAFLDSPGDWIGSGRRDARGVSSKNPHFSGRVPLIMTVACHFLLAQCDGHC